jgi:hypothetical protein
MYVRDVEKLYCYTNHSTEQQLASYNTFVTCAITNSSYVESCGNPPSNSIDDSVNQRRAHTCYAETGHCRGSMGRSDCIASIRLNECSILGCLDSSEVVVVLQTAQRF